MKFGPVEIGLAEGGVLAHSVALGGRRRLRKGRVLTESDIAALAGAGIDVISIARLDANDVPENEAAAALAAALVPDPEAQHLKVGAAFTGRVNLAASGPGVVLIDPDAVHAANMVNPAITIATVKPYQQMATGGMVATIKIISYAVPKDDLDKVCALAEQAISLAPPVIRSVGLIITDIDGGAGAKGQKAIANRVAALGLTLDDPVRVPHDESKLAQALINSSSVLTLILTGSATSDSSDVAPNALRMAGGRVARFGMPVDPGNLLFLGDLFDQPVIGLPGCARSPALNGADWVLARVICGIEVTDTDIAGMGVGGLLKEIPSRPQPREG